MATKAKQKTRQQKKVKKASVTRKTKKVKKIKKIKKTSAIRNQKKQKNAKKTYLHRLRLPRPRLLHLRPVVRVPLRAARSKRKGGQTNRRGLFWFWVWSFNSMWTIHRFGVD